MSPRTLLCRRDVLSHRTLRRGVGIALASTTFATLAACSTVGASGDSQPATSSTSVAAVAEADAFLAPYSSTPVTWSGPTDVTGHATGKSVIFLDPAPTTDFGKQWEEATIAAGKALGWQVTNIDASKGFDDAVSQAIVLKPSVVLTAAADSNAHRAAVDRLNKAGIVTVSSIDGGRPNIGYRHIVDLQIELQGELAAAAAVKDRGGNAKIGLIECSGGAQTVKLHLDGVKKYVNAHSGATIVAEQTDACEFPTVGQNTVAFLQAHPDVNFLPVEYDGLASAVVPAIEQAGLGDRVHVVSYEGANQNLGFIRKNEVQVADITAAMSWVVWAAFDQANRILLGHKVDDVATDGVPIRVLTKDNLPAPNTPWNSDVDYEAHYRKIWANN
ncbi:MAG: sugar ABC transporter substrate-binding protein [Gordonia sp. (in: high G+C Gram-positive bacteria)]